MANEIISRAYRIQFDYAIKREFKSKVFSMKKLFIAFIFLIYVRIWWMKSFWIWKELFKMWRNLKEFFKVYLNFQRFFHILFHILLISKEKMFKMLEDIKKSPVFKSEQILCWQQVFVICHNTHQMQSKLSFSCSKLCVTFIFIMIFMHNCDSWL